MNLIPPTSPEYFHQTSEDPYDRHTYRLHLSNGEHRDFNSWEETAGAWFIKKTIKQKNLMEVLNSNGSINTFTTTERMVRCPG